MTFNAQEVYQIAATVWEATLELNVECAASEPVQAGNRSTVSCIQITGAWNGAILLECTAEAARRAAAIMFATEPAQVTTGDLQDAVAELANMIGGNFKALLPETCYLSLPSVVEGGDYSTRVPGSRTLGRVGFTCEGHAVSISILERIEEQVAAA
jgi:chemotaxis protein CheX